MVKRISLVTLFISVVMSLLVSACSLGQAGTTPTSEPGTQVDVNPVISATGAVIPAQWSTLSLSTAGVVEQVLVEEGQQVAAGQVLVRLQGQDSLKAAVAAAELELTSAQQALDLLNENAETAKAQAQLRLANAEKALDKAKDRREGKNYKRADPSLIAAAKADYIMAKDAFEQAEQDWSGFEGMDEENVNRAFALAQYEAARRKRDQALWNYNYLQSMPDKLEVDVSEGELVVAKAEVEAAKQEWNRVKDGADPRQISLVQARLKSAQAQLSAAQNSLADLELKAPFEGTVSKVYLHRQEFTNPGQAVLQLADLKHLRVETTDLNEIDVAQINLNDVVTVTFDALPDVKLTGKISSIGTKSSEGAGVNYPVTIDLSEIPAKLRWGMTAFVDIAVKK